MRIFIKRTLKEFSKRHNETKKYLDGWYKTNSETSWKSPREIKENFPKASILSDNRVVFDVLGGKYRLIVKYNYLRSWAFIRFIGTHNEYDKIDATKI